MKTFASTAVIALLAFAAAPAYAEKVGPVDVSTGVMVELKNEYHVESEDANLDEANHLAAKMELTPEVSFGNGFSVEGQVTVEPTPQAKTLNQSDSITFGHEGAFVEMLYVEYEQDAFEIKVGKINPDYGKAWDFGRGIWGEDFAEDYELAEMIGVSSEYEFTLGAFGEHEISGATFFRDTTVLSDSIFTSRGVRKLSTGGAANTEDFSSFVVELEGEVVPVNGLEYRIATRHLAEQDKNRSATTAAEEGALVGATYVAKVNDNVGVDVLVEHTHINNFNGTKNDNRVYSDFSVVTTLYDNWNVATSMTLRDISGAGASTVSDDVLLNLSGGYSFDNGMKLEAGYRGSNEANNETHIFGLQLRYEGEFGK